MKNKVVIAEKEAAPAEEPNPKGIPGFWFTIFRNVDMLSELVQVSAHPPVDRCRSENRAADLGVQRSFMWVERHFLCPRHSGERSLPRREGLRLSQPPE